MQIYISKNVHSLTLCPKGTQKPSNLHSSPKRYHDISNIKIYIPLTYTPHIVGSIKQTQLTCATQFNNQLWYILYTLSTTYFVNYVFCQLRNLSTPILSPLILSSTCLSTMFCQLGFCQTLRSQIEWQNTMTKIQW